MSQPRPGRRSYSYGAKHIRLTVSPSLPRELLLASYLLIAPKKLAALVKSPADFTLSKILRASGILKIGGRGGRDRTKSDIENA